MECTPQLEKKTKFFFEFDVKWQKHKRKTNLSTLEAMIRTIEIKQANLSNKLTFVVMKMSSRLITPSLILVRTAFPTSTSFP